MEHLCMCGLMHYCWLGFIFTDWASTFAAIGRAMSFGVNKRGVAMGRLRSSLFHSYYRAWVDVEVEVKPQHWRNIMGGDGGYEKSFCGGYLFSASSPSNIVMDCTCDCGLKPILLTSSTKKKILIERF